MAFQHTAARRRLGEEKLIEATRIIVSTHSRPKAAGSGQRHHNPPPIRFNTQPPEGGWLCLKMTKNTKIMFQHTAARRRLAPERGLSWQHNLFQHTAARRRLANILRAFDGHTLFQHTAARRRLGRKLLNQSLFGRFQHTAARRRLEPILYLPF